MLQRKDLIGSLIRSRVAILSLAIFTGVAASSTLVGVRSLGIPLLYVLAVLCAIGCAAVAFRNMSLALTVVVLSSATVNFSIATSTPHAITVPFMLVALLTGLWLLQMVASRRLVLQPTPLNVPLLAFLVASAISWIAGLTIGNPYVIFPNTIRLAQVGQFAIFALSAASFLLAANHRLSTRTLELWTGFIILMGFVVICFQLLRWPHPFSAWTGSLLMWPFALLLAQILFNDDLSRRIKVLGWGMLAVWAWWAVKVTITWKSGWVPALISFLLLFLLKSRRLFLLVCIIAAVAFFVIRPGVVITALTSDEQNSLLSTRSAIWVDVFRLGARSALLGYGPATYKYYWQDPSFESASYKEVSPYAFQRQTYAPPAHNMYADIFAQTGVVGFFFFMWALFEGVRLGFRARRCQRSGFAAAHANGVLCGFVSLMISSFVFADWLVPYVFNIGLIGFRHSVYAWLLLGTLVQLQLSPENKG